MATVPPANPQTYGALPPPVKKGLGPLAWVLIILGSLFVLFVLTIVAGGLFIVHKVKQAGLDPDLMKRNPGLAVTKLITTVNPNTEVLNVDEARGIIHIRDKQNGRTYTMNFEDAKRGKMVFQEDGKDAVTLTATGDGQKAKVVVRSNGKDTLTLNASGDEKSGTLDIKTADGTTKLGASAANAPSWLPVYPGSQPEGLVGADTAEATTGSFHFATKDALEKVATFYKNSLTLAGFKLGATTTEAGGKASGALSAEDEAKNRTVLIGYNVENGQSSVTVGFSQKK
ncbi:MAG: hypothetical protein ACR2IV_10875 [Bryobacteraceae bacterium]